MEWRSVWYAMRDFLQSSRVCRRPMIELYKLLKSPPFGLREGPIPVLVCALLLAHKDRIALYEEGRFIPELRIEILELLIKAPETFEIQLYELAGERNICLNSPNSRSDKKHVFGIFDLEKIFHICLT